LRHNCRSGPALRGHPGCGTWSSFDYHRSIAWGSGGSATPEESWRANTTDPACLAQSESSRQAKSGWWDRTSWQEGELIPNHSDCCGDYQR
ncbi:MAG: hypothetical protein ACE5G5_10760, partial [Candidatus Methylomirabilales bacterium]